MNLFRKTSLMLAVFLLVLVTGCSSTPEVTPVQPEADSSLQPTEGQPTQQPTLPPTQPPNTAVPREVFDFSTTAFGFFPTPPEPDPRSTTKTIKAMKDHADVLLFQEPVPWTDFVDGADVESSSITRIADLTDYIQFYGMQPIMVVDPLNGLNRREFQGIPEEWEAADFSTPEVRKAYQNFAVRLAREFQPRYLGLASEINTYLDAYPEDGEQFLSLYQETYAAVKEVSPDTQVFVTFQWDDLNRLDGDGERFDIKWDQVEAFEPRLDIWAISSYPHFFFDSPSDVPEDYYTPLLKRTEKPLAVAEGGWTSQEAGGRPGTPDGQVEHLHRIDRQLGDRLVFWINLLYADLDWPAYSAIFAEQGMEEDMNSLSNFIYLGLVETDGTPKPALKAWDELRAESR